MSRYITTNQCFIYKYLIRFDVRSAAVGMYQGKITEKETIKRFPKKVLRCAANASWHVINHDSHRDLEIAPAIRKDASEQT